MRDKGAEAQNFLCSVSLLFLRQSFFAEAHDNYARKKYMRGAERHRPGRRHRGAKCKAHGFRGGIKC
jgi:hypothetical protein